jgi:cell division protein FtsB
MASGESTRVSPAERAGGRRGRGGRRVARLLVPALLAVVAFLYWRPLTSYVETRSELAQRREETRELRRERSRLEARYRRETTLEALGREARRLGYVSPGERLFIVKGVQAWRRADRARLARDGGS